MSLKLQTLRENKLGMMDSRGLKDAHSNTCKTVATIDAGLNAVNTTVNEAKVPRENLKVDKVKRNVRTRGQSLMYAEDSCPEQIITPFLHYGDREFIFSKAKRLKDTEYGISDDFPHQIMRQEMGQGKKLFEARKAGKLAYFSSVELDKLFIDGV